MASKYLYVRASPGHPLLPVGGTWLGEHRIVLWNKIGPGSHPCHHCGIPVRWMPGSGARTGALVVDHLDDDSRNNSPENLVASCQPCNQLRSPRKNRVRDEESFVVQPRSGTRVRATQTECLNCGKSFLAPRRRVKTQRFCGRSCSSLYTSVRRPANSYKTSRSIQDGEPYVMKGKDRVRAVRKTCDGCQESYLVVRSGADKSRYCGKDCRLKALHSRGTQG